MTKLPINGVIGASIVAAVIAVALVGAVWTPYDPLVLDYTARLAAPGSRHLLGTDEFGRDVLSRLMSGAATSAWISLLTVASAIVIGTLIGVATGFTRGLLDRIVMTFNDALQAFPGILLALGIMAVVGANKYGIVLALALAYSPSVVRIVRGAAMSISSSEFIEASRISGNSDLYTVFRHVLPNCVAPISVVATSMFGWVLLAESALSFLGLGVPPPAPTWGSMLASSRPYMDQAVWLGIFPGLCISLALLGINLTGDLVRDKLDPHMRGLV